ncbi:ATP-binding cassette, subfamily B [Syntrophus gentianae]|uniref:ATP-binding cassette, subfamily B n=1 Tax=Syntrophus gentianae TaxID=43775 RepID=A0A1H8A8C9_9BACT|nr:ABC transporter ATP-binding protein [Syntrophus gentianae]SEM67152.1 ATP-binding cassette, subfamily B [Syntrophus gentianae]
MKRFHPFLQPYWKSALMAPLFMMLEVTCDLLQPTLMARIVDKGIAGGNTDLILGTGVLMTAVALIGVGGGLGCTFFACHASQNFGADLRAALFAKTQSFSFKNLDAFSTASLITRLTNDVTQVQNIVLAMLRLMVRAPLLCLGGILMAVALNPGLATILGVTLPLLALTLFLIIRSGFPLFSQVQQRLDRVNAVLRENLSGVRVIKAFVRSDYEIGRFGKANSDLADMTIRAGRRVGTTMPAMFALMNLSVVAVIWFGGLRVDSGNMQVGQVMAFITYVTQILFALMMVAFMTVMLTRAKASSDRIGEVLEAKVDISSPARPAGHRVQLGRIEFENVSFCYDGNGGVPALQGITFSASPGELIAVLGATGSGKSTLVNLIPRFYDVSSGRVLIDGVDVRDYGLDDLRQGIGMVFQESRLFSGTILENIRWGNPEASAAEIEQAARTAQAHEFISKFPNGYDTRLDQRGLNLSGGQKQRLSIARALLRKPRILLLDDAASALDPATEARLRKELRGLKETTCLMIAQRVASVLDADRLLLLDEGRLIGLGTHRQLMAECPLCREIFASQLGNGRLE